MQEEGRRNYLPIFLVLFEFLSLEVVSSLQLLSACPKPSFVDDSSEE